MTEAISNAALPTAAPLDLSTLRKLANEQLGKAVDWDMVGSPITDCDVLLHGAYGPAVMRLMKLVAGEPAQLDMARLAELAPVAFAQAQDIDFGGNILEEYRIVLLRPYGFGDVTLKLANLVIEHAPVLRRAAASA